MADTYNGAMGGYANVTQATSAAAQTAIIAEVNKFKALIPDPTDTDPGPKPHPDFDQISPALAYKLRKEIDALTAAIDAAPTA